MSLKLRRQRSTSKTEFQFARLERRNLLANDMLPDIFAWASEDRGYMYDYVVEGDLLRFTTAFANQGEGHLEVFGGDATSNGNQEVFQRIYDDEGGFRDRLAGEFTYHPSHGHIHFDGYAIYNLRAIGPNGEVGDILATGGKISFCLIDITRYDDSAGSSQYGSCGTTQGVSAGWSDVYGRGLSDQWINISGIDDGDYYLEVVTDPENQLEESDETNNTTIITVTIVDGPGNTGDRFEANNTFQTASNLGMFSERVEPGLSLHSGDDVDFYQFNAVDHGDFSIHVNFAHDLGNIDAFVYDKDFNLIASGDSTDDLEDLHFHTHPNEAYFLEIVSADGIANGYDLEFDGPGEVITVTTFSDDVPVSIPDGASSNTPGATVTSTIEGPDVTLTDLNLIFAELRHTWMGDLSFELTSPAGTTATILPSQWESPSGPLGSEDDFLNTTLDDQAPTSIEDGNAPFSGSFNVNYGSVSNPLSVFSGESALGTWTVSITDWYSGDTGTLHSWALMFTGIENNPGDAWEQNDAFPQATDLGVIGTVSQDGLSVHNQADVDFFRFNAQDSTHVQIDLEFVHDDGNLDFAVYDSNQQVIARSESVTDNESLVIPVDEGELYFVEVYGVESQTNSYNLDMDVPELVASTGVIEELGLEWQTVYLPQEFDQPVIIVSSPDYIRGSSAVVKIGTVTSNSFNVRLENWNSKHATHSVSGLEYLVIEAGEHVMRDGTRISAGRGNSIGNVWKPVSFETSFDSTPVLITQLEGKYNFGEINRLSAISPTGFQIMSQSNAGTKTTGQEYVAHWLAIEAGAGSSAGGLFEANLLPAEVDHKPSKFEFESDFDGGVKSLFVASQTANDLNPANARLFAVEQAGASVFMEGVSVEHAAGAETMAYLAFQGVSQFYAMEPVTSEKSGSSDSRDSNFDNDKQKRQNPAVDFSLGKTLLHRSDTLDKASYSKFDSGEKSNVLTVPGVDDLMGDRKKNTGKLPEAESRSVKLYDVAMEDLLEDRQLFQELLHSFGPGSDKLQR